MSRKPDSELHHHARQSLEGGSQGRLDLIVRQGHPEGETGVGPLLVRGGFPVALALGTEVFLDEKGHPGRIHLIAATDDLEGDSLGKFLDKTGFFAH